ncbi:MFS transporter, partial [Nonomuraea rhizosphaerae]|uniref:MFS transporter n=1 Tax=Nonomuraea rhizosphaerae TaxID=2665663 RepID=UPI001C6048B9
MARPGGVAGTYVRWTGLRALLHRGYVLVSNLYFVLVGRLTAADLLLLGTVVAAAMVVSDLPAGVWSDARSRRWTLVAGHALLAVAMTMTGLVTSLPAIVVTQVLWGCGWALMSGADVAWVTDELTGELADDLSNDLAGDMSGEPAGGLTGACSSPSSGPDAVARVLAGAARWELLGGAAGTVAFGLLAWIAGLAAAIVVSGAGMALLAVHVAARFTERHFTPASHRRWSILRRGVTLARRDREIRLMLAATMLLNGAAVVSWLFPQRLITLGLPADPALWYTALVVCASGAGVVALRVAQPRLGGGVRGLYAGSCLLGVLGLAVLAGAPEAVSGAAGVLLVNGVAFTLTRAVSVIWVNRRVTGDVRATVHSLLSQAETAGKVAGGFALAALAVTAGPSRSSSMRAYRLCRRGSSLG